MVLMVKMDALNVVSHNVAASKNVSTTLNEAHVKRRDEEA
jgi:hypothetical protein